MFEQQPYAPPSTPPEAPPLDQAPGGTRRLTREAWIAVIALSVVLGILSAFYPFFVPVLWLLIAAVVVRSLYQPSGGARAEPFRPGLTALFAIGCSLVGYVIYVPVCTGLGAVVFAVAEPLMGNWFFLPYGAASVVAFLAAMLVIVRIGAAVFGRDLPEALDEGMQAEGTDTGRPDTGRPDTGRPDTGRSGTGPPIAPSRPTPPPPPEEPRE